MTAGSLDSPALVEPIRDPKARFAHHCHLFYSLSLSHPPKNVPPLTKSILETFQSIVASSGDDDTAPRPETSTAREEIKACGFDALPNDVNLIDDYQKIRDVERRKAHETQMNARSELLRNLIHDNDITDAPTNLSSREDNRKLRHLVAEYVRTYGKDIGCHPFLAGLRELLSRQLATKDHVLRWTFDGTALTENMTIDAQFLRRSVRLLKSFTVEVTNPEDAKGSAGDYCWEVVGDWSDVNLRQVLNALPPGRDLEGRPTGSIDVGDGKRRNAGGEMDEKLFFSEWCVVL